MQQTPSAEFGVKGGAAINVVMKSGGNTPHGTGYYFRHDDWTDSPNFFVKRAAGGEHDAGRRTRSTAARSAGRSRRTRRSIFGYYEGQRLAVTSPYVRARADARRRSRRRGAHRGRRPDSRIRSARTCSKFYPTDPLGQPSTSTRRTSSNMNTFSVKLDHQLNARAT